MTMRRSGCRSAPSGLTISLSILTPGSRPRSPRSIGRNPRLLHHRAPARHVLHRLGAEFLRRAPDHVVAQRPDALLHVGRREPRPALVVQLLYDFAVEPGGAEQARPVGDLEALE